MVDLQKMADAVFASVKGYVSSALQPLADRIKALEEREPTKGEDGKSVTVDDVAPLIHDAVAKAVSELPPAKDGQDADQEAIADHAATHARKAAEEWCKANPAADGKSVTIDDVAPLIVGEVAKAIAALPAPDKGDPGKDADMDALKAHAATEARQAAEEWLKANPPKNGEDGKTFTLDEVRALVREAVESEQAKWALDFERRAQGVLERSVERLPKPKDGEDGKDGLGFDDMRMEYDGERSFTFIFERGEVEKSYQFHAPITLYRGTFVEGRSYEQNDLVTWAGSTWVALTETKSKPGEGDGWKLIVKKGRDGKDAK